MGRLSTVSELTEEPVLGLEPVRQERANDNPWQGGGSDVGGGGGGEDSVKKPIAVAITEPEETESDETVDSTTVKEGTMPVTDGTTETSATEPDATQTLPVIEGTEAPEETEGMLQIWHDHDNNSETPIEAAEEKIVLESMAEGETYTLYANGDGALWMTTDKEIATVDDMGIVTFTGEEGDVTIELWNNNGSGTRDDYVTFTTQTADTVAVKEETPEKSSLLDGIGNPILLGVIALLMAAVVALVALRVVEQNKRKKRRQERARERAAKAAEAAAAAEEIADDSELVVQPAVGVRSGVYQHIGARKDQQDSYGMTDPALYTQQGVLAVVADGMGGLANGKAVSSTLVNTFLQDYRVLVNRETPQDTLMKMAISANQRINQMLMGAERSGSTLLSAIIQDGQLYFMTVGDSRIYLYRKGALLQLNREHIYQEELALKAANCQVPLAQVTADRQAHALTSFFGNGNLTYVDRNYEGIRLVPGDRVVLCSDGVFGTLTQAQMEQALESDVKTAAETLRDMVLEVGKPHQDNNTCVILEYLG